METTLIINALEQANGTLTLQGWSLVTPRSKALKAFGKEVMWITYQQPVDNYKSAILCISLATYYILTRYNKAMFNEVGDPEMKNTLLIVLIFTLMLFADAISNGICSLIFGV